MLRKIKRAHQKGESSVRFEKILVAAAVLVSVVPAQAGTNTIFGLWRLGEADPGAVSGNAGNATTIDSSGNGHTLSLVGTPAPTYTNQTPVGSTLGMIFGGTSGYSGASIATGVNNWGVEIWAYPTSVAAGTRSLIYNGNTSTAGFGIYQNGANWALLYGGVILTNVAPVTINQWTDLALVRDAGNATLYVNGVATATTNLAPNPISGNMCIGINQAGTEQFIGRLDEGRIFTFTSPFNPSTLFINQPVSVPALSTLGLAMLAILILASAGIALRRNPRAA
jgi:Concanavalin A-like lectin/glucanases superfamily